MYVSYAHILTHRACGHPEWSVCSPGYNTAAPTYTRVVQDKGMLPFRLSVVAVCAHPRTRSDENCESAREGFEKYASGVCVQARWINISG